MMLGGGGVAACWLEEWWKHYCVSAYDPESSKLSSVHCGSSRCGGNMVWSRVVDDDIGCRLVKPIKRTAVDLLFCGAGRDKQYMTR